MKQYSIDSKVQDNIHLHYPYFDSLLIAKCTSYRLSLLCTTSSAKLVNVIIIMKQQLTHDRCVPGLQSKIGSFLIRYLLITTVSFIRSHMTVYICTQLHYICTHTYCKQGKIRWSKLSWIPPNKVFHRKTFVVPYI